jgi:hypothetical protein
VQSYARDAANGGLEECLRRLHGYKEVAGMHWVQFESPHSSAEIQRQLEERYYTPVDIETSDRRDGAPVDDILAAGDRCGAIRGQEGDQLGDLCRPSRTAQRDAAE